MLDSMATRRYLSSRPRHRRILLVSVSMLMTLLGGCATTGNPRDPLEPMNRAIYSFYDGVDKVILKPVAEAYRNVLPPFVRTGASNIFSNINEVPVAVNNLRQGKLADATSDAGRVVINTTLGVLGIIDGASEFGMVKHNEDFGQTLGYWGMDEGPFLMVPLLGPSNLRDTLGRVADFKLDPITYVDPSRERNIVWGSRSVSQRADFLDISKILETAALDPYAFLRDAYLQRRRNVVNDGSPPPEKDDDFEIKMKQPRTEPNDATARRPSGAAASAVVDPL